MTVNGPGAAGEPQKPIQAYEGISLDTIKKNGTEADVRAINIYDYAGDGKLTGSEVSVFNNTQRTLSDDGKTLTITNKQDGKNQEIKITSSNDFIDSQKLSDIDLGSKQSKDPQQMHIGEDYVRFVQKSDDGKHTMQGAFELGPDAKVDINVDTGEMSIKGAVGTDNLVGGVNVELNVENSEFKEISATNSKLTLDGVHDRTMFFETDTEVKLNGNSILNQKDSQIDVNE